MLKFIKITNGIRHIDWIIATSIFAKRPYKIVKNGSGILCRVNKDKFVVTMLQSDIYV